MAKKEAATFWKHYVEVAPGLAIERQLSVGRQVGDYRVEVEVGVEDGRLVAESVTVSRRRGGPPVTGEAIRGIPVARMTHEAGVMVRQVVDNGDGSLTVTTRSLDDETAERLRDNGPTAETLEWVAYLYRVALLRGDPPTQSVQESLDIPRSTAGRWVAAARSAGLLGPTEAGKAGV